MALLLLEEKEHFDEFIEWRKEAVGYLDDKTIAQVYYILFGSFGDRNLHNTWGVCGNDSCRNCKMYEHNRCHAYVKSAYADSPQRMRDIMKSNYARSDYDAHKRALQFIKRDATRLCLIVGSYRLELFKEEMHYRAQKAVERHNRLNRDNKIDKPKDITPKYYSLEHIKENDFWGMFKETKMEGDLLCSILSDF